MLDLIPSLTFLLLNTIIAVSVAGRWDPWDWRLAPRGPALIWAGASALYGFGTLLFLLLGQWRPGLALAQVGTLLVPSTLLLFLMPESRARPLLLALPIVTWSLLWLPSFESLPLGLALPKNGLTLFLLVTMLLSCYGLWLRHQQRSLEEVHKRAFFIALPFFLLGVLYLQLRSSNTPKAVFSGCIHVASEILLLSMIGPKPRQPSSYPFLTVVLQALLLCMGAFLVTLFAANLGYFPKAAGPILVSTSVATVLSVATGLGRRPLDLLIKNTLYPETMRVQKRLIELEKELKTTQSRLRQAEHSSVVAQLAAQVAHEIKNPLGPIKGYTKIIERELEKAGVLNEVTQRGLDIIRQEVEAIDSHARGLMGLARPLRLTVADLDYCALGQDVIDLVRSQAPGNLTIDWERRPRTALGRGDAVILRSAILNVVQNAVQALAGGDGAVRLSLEETQGGWRLCVDDDGPGLPEGDLESLFQPFVSHREGGTGLGLVIARGALQSSGGQLLLERRPKGTRARLELPGKDQKDSERSS